MSLKTLLSSKIVFFILLAFLAFLTNLKYKQWQHQKAIDREKANLISQVESLNKKNQELKDSLTYLTSPNFKERVARQQLNLKKEGEIAYGFPEDLGGGTTTLVQAATLKKSNFQKWIEYFTSHR